MALTAFFNFRYQDIVLLQFNEQVFVKNRLVAWASGKLKQHGVMGLKEAPFFCGLLEKLPTLLQDQYSFEKVFIYLLYSRSLHCR